MIGDFLFVNKMRYGLNIPFTEKRVWLYDTPKRGDIVTFTPPLDSPLDGKTLVKRVIGVPGDKIRIHDDEVIANGVRYPTKELKNKKLLSSLGGSDPESLQLFQETVLDPSTQKPVVNHYILKLNQLRKLSQARFYHGFPEYSSAPWMKSKGFLQKLHKRIFSPGRMALQRHIIREYSTDHTNRMRNPDREWEIPAGYYMVMGDNRDNSDDSRGCSLVAGELNREKCFRAEYPESAKKWGLIPLENIQGKVFLSYFSVNWGTGTNSGGNPIENFFRLIKGEFSGVYVRWSRIFRRIY